MKKWLCFLLGMIILLGAAAGYASGYDSVSKLPGTEVGQVQLSVAIDASFKPGLSCNFPTAQYGFNRMDVRYSVSDDDWASIIFKDSGSGMEYWGLGWSNKYSSFAQAKQFILNNAVYGGMQPSRVDFYVESDTLGKIVTYSLQKQRYLYYIEWQPRGSGAATDGKLYLYFEADYDQEGKLSQTWVEARRNSTQFVASYTRYGWVRSAYIITADQTKHNYDQKTGLFDGLYTQADLGFPDVALSPWAVLDAPPKGAVAQSVTGGSNVTANAGELVSVYKSQFSLYPAGSLLNGRGSYDDCSFDLSSGNTLWQNSTLCNSDGTPLQPGSLTGLNTAIHFRPHLPGYYMVQPVLNYFDEVENQKYEVYGKAFVLQVNDENGTPPPLDDLAVSIYSIPSAVVGETIQINWQSVNTVGLKTNTIRVLLNGVLQDEWIYDGDQNQRDTYTITAAGNYTVEVITRDQLGRTASDSLNFVAEQPKPLVVKSLTLGRDSMHPDIANRIVWTLDYEGGYGTKSTVIQLFNIKTWEKVGQDLTDGFRPSWGLNSVPDGSYIIRMNVIDDQGDHWFNSNVYTVWTDYNQADMILPASLSRIEDEAFQGITARTVRVPDPCQSIGERAFADATIVAVYLPAGVSEIGANAFPAGTAIYTPDGSYAAQWGAANGYTVYTVK